jgi:hypothetical protein
MHTRVSSKRKSPDTVITKSPTSKRPIKHRGDAGGLSNNSDIITGNIFFHFFEPNIIALIANLDNEIRSNLLNSLGRIDKLYLFDSDENETWSERIMNPLLGLNYHPPFYNRNTEYGNKHIYYESLCHADYNNKFKIINSSTPRYINDGEQAIEMNLVPATASIVSFVRAFREANAQFLFELQSQLHKINFPYTDEFVDGCFKNIAIQIHYGEPTKPLKYLMHRDLIHSALHCGITLNGQRDLALQVKSKLKCQTMSKGMCYVSSPTAITHGISTPKLDQANASIAIQLRTLLRCEVATHIGKLKFKQSLCRTVLSLLKQWDGRLVLPNVKQFSECYKSFEVELTHRSEKKISPTINYSNKLL